MKAALLILFLAVNAGAVPNEAQASTGYTDLKAVISKKSLSWQYDETTAKYSIFALDGNLRYDAVVWKSGYEPDGVNVSSNTADRSDFETNYKALANYAVGVAQPSFAVGTTAFGGNASSGTVNAGSSNVAIDLYISSVTYPNGAYSNGLMVMTKNALLGDYIALQAVDVSGALTGVPGKVVAQPIIKWYIDPDMRIDNTTVYAKLLPPGLTLRLLYTSTGGVLAPDVIVAVNYRLHKP